MGAIFSETPETFCALPTGELPVFDESRAGEYSGIVPRGSLNSFGYGYLSQLFCLNLQAGLSRTEEFSNFPRMFFSAVCGRNRDSSVTQK